MNRKKEPLYRKYNKTARGFHENHPGGDFRHTRNTKEFKKFKGSHKPIKKTQGGFDYTPLFRFLLSKIGKDWTEVHSEAVSRLDSDKPIFWMVILDVTESDKKFPYINIGESSKWSKLYVDENNTLQKVDENYTANDVWPACDCCTYTFNGKKVSNKYPYHPPSNSADPSKKIFLG